MNLFQIFIISILLISFTALIYCIGVIVDDIEKNIKKIRNRKKKKVKAMRSVEIGSTERNINVWKIDY